jgi:hypothetical protein
MRTKETGVGNYLMAGVGNYVIAPLGNYLTLQRLRLGDYLIVDIGTADQVERYVAGLLDECATDGGVVLRNGAVLDVAKAENLKAMIDTGRSWRG